ncbi:MAG: hypothetical protein V1853_01530 [bacterium]
MSKLNLVCVAVVLFLIVGSTNANAGIHIQRNVSDIVEAGALWLPIDSCREGMVTTVTIINDTDEMFEVVALESNTHQSEVMSNQGETAKKLPF